MAYGGDIYFRKMVGGLHDGRILGSDYKRVRITSETGIFMAHDQRRPDEPGDVIYERRGDDWVYDEQ